MNMSAEEYRKLQGEPSQAKKQLKNQINGRINRRNGELFENLIKQSCEHYDMNGVAYIEKTPEPMRPITGQDRQGAFKAVFTKKAQADYKGVLDGGVAVGFEAKHTETERLQQSCVSDEQEKCLNKMEARGAVCFVMCSFGFRRFFKIPWAVWKDMKTIYGRKYIKADDVEQYEVEYRGQLLFLEEWR